MNIHAFAKMLHRPGEAFEELKGSVTARDGFLVYVLVSVLSLVLFTGFARSSGFGLMPLNFGFGSVFEPASMGLFFVVNFFGLGVVAWSSNLIAKRWSNTEALPQTFGMLAYARVLNVVKALVGSLLVLWITLMATRAVIQAGYAGVIQAPNFALIQQVMILVAVLFFGWQLFLDGKAVSAAHKIALKYGIGSAFVGTVLMGIVLFVGGRLL